VAPREDSSTATADDAGATSPRRRDAVASASWRPLILVCLACFFSEVGWAGLAVAVPVVVRDLDADPTAATWLVLGPQLAATAFMITFGRLADIFGRRLLFVGGVGVFTVASLLCGLAPNAWVLVATQVLVAMACGAIVANGAAILVDTYAAERLSHALGVYVASFSAAALLGPAAGGLVADTIGWRWLFWSGVPVGVACLLWGLRALPRTPGTSTTRLDVPGLVLLPVALLGVVFTLTQAGQVDWRSPGALAGVVGVVLVLVVFVVVEHRARDPIMDFSLFSHRPFALAMASAFVNAMALYTVPLLVALFFQASLGDSAFEAGLKITPLSAIDGVLALAAGLLTRFGRPRSLAVVGSAMAAAGIILLQLSIHESYTWTAVALVLTGAGVGIFLPANANVVMADVPTSSAGVTNAVRLTLQSVGGLLCTTVCLALITGSLSSAAREGFFAGEVSELGPDALPRLNAAYDTALTFLAVLAVLGTLAAGASWAYARRHDTTTAEARPGDPDDDV
jgi:EmrB/QacA subfamily drug resistance transporter